MTDKIGENYSILRELRRGSWVTVYEAEHAVLQRKTLIKWLNPSYKNDKELVGRLNREARLGAAVDHPNVAKIYEVAECDERPYVAVEWIEGEDFGDFLERQQHLTAQETLVYAKQLLSGLQAIHNAGVVHRDLSPGNIRITQKKRLKITDFGLAIGKFETKYTLPGSVIGTPGYLSPEQASGKEATRQSDLFAVGVILHEALTGKRLFYDDDIISILKRIREEEAPLLEPENPDLPEGFDRWMNGLLAKDPCERFESAEEAEQALCALLPEEETHEDLPVVKEKKRGIVFPVVGFLVLLGTIYALYSFVLKGRPVEERSADRGAELQGMVVDTTAFAADSIASVDREPSAKPDNQATKPDKDAAIKDQRLSTEFTESALDTQTRRTLDSKNKSEAVNLPVEERDAPGGAGDFTPVVPDVAKESEGWIVITTSPWADVYANSERIGTTPALKFFSLSESSSTITLDNPGFPPITVETDVILGDTVSVSIALADYVGRIAFKVTPWANVYIDNRLKGTTPLPGVLYVSPGVHAIRLEHPSLGRIERTISVKAGETKTIIEDMSKAGTSLAPDKKEEKRNTN